MRPKHDPVYVPDSGIRTRAAARVDVCFEIDFSGRAVTGSGVVRNISSSGALIADADPALKMDTEVKLQFSLFEDSLPISVRGVVRRETPDGFAVQFIEMNPRTRKVLRTSIAKALSRAQAAEESSQAGRLGDKPK